MSKSLIIVESPAKIKTIKKYLGKNYNVAATVGHIRDLPVKEMGIDIKNDFKPKYSTIQGKQKVIAALKRAAVGVSDVYLAPDPDREGEAIAFHTAEILKKKGVKFHRVLFHELTKNAIREALKSPEELNKNKYEAQQTRRIVDRLVGYQVSPLLWRKVKGGLSAGRVQSVAVRIICEREKAIQAFNSEEYWSITAHLECDSPPPFTAKLAKKNNKKIKIPNQEAANNIVKEVSVCKLIVEKIVRKTIRRNPLPPFITSKLQQESIHKLRFSAKKTMAVAQQLYEGIELGAGSVDGLITYMRTDSTRMSNEATSEAIQFIQEKFGKEYSIDKPRVFKNRKKAQDAHEAIRPTSVFNTPEKMAAYLNKEQLSLYTIIWNRFVASQMQQALIDNVSVSIKAGDYLFTASGSTVKFPGFMIIYKSVDDEIKSKKEDKKEKFPKLSEKMELKLNKLEPKQHFTLPPPRFSEASLVKELEENGIGRPSTYATILSTIRDKGYVDLVKGYFAPNEMGFIINSLLIKNFPDVFDVNFTAKMEDNLDRVEAAESNYLKILSGFYGSFEKELESASTNMLSMRGEGIPTGIECPKCKTAQLHIKVSKNGHYLACNGYPKCSYTRNYTRDEKGIIQIIEASENAISDKICAKCGMPMVVKQGKYGEFIACTGYPDCKTTQSLSSNKASQTTNIKCTVKDCDGVIMQRYSKRGKVFYGCSKYPECKFATWHKPVDEKCPKCGAEFLVEQSTKKRGDFLMCIADECGFTKEISEK